MALNRRVCTRPGYGPVLTSSTQTQMVERAGTNLIRSIRPIILP